MWGLNFETTWEKHWGSVPWQFYILCDFLLSLTSSSNSSVARSIWLYWLGSSVWLYWLGSLVSWPTLPTSYHFFKKNTHRSQLLILQGLVWFGNTFQLNIVKAATHSLGSPAMHGPALLFWKVATGVTAATGIPSHLEDFLQNQLSSYCNVCMESLNAPSQVSVDTCTIHVQYTLDFSLCTH